MDIVEEFLELGKNAPRTLLAKIIQVKHVSNLCQSFLHSAFLLPSSKVSVATLIDLLRVLRRRIPSKHLPIFRLQLLSEAVLWSLQVTDHMQLLSFGSLKPEEKFAKSSCDRRR